jgi:hypothetical protein
MGLKKMCYEDEKSMEVVQDSLQQCAWVLVVLTVWDLLRLPDLEQPLKKRTRFILRSYQHLIIGNIAILDKQ